MISESELARLYLSLEGAQLVRDLLRDEEIGIDGFDFDLLASLLSESTPQKCLLILACSAGAMCDYVDVEPALKLSFKMLAGDVLDDYAPLYLDALKSGNMANFEAQIIYMQEDLESFSELFALAGDLSEPDSLEYQICTILSDQACAQAEYLDTEDIEIDYNPDHQNGIERPSLIIFSDNIIPFPGLLRKQ